MKISQAQFNLRDRSQAKTEGAFTLPELLISTTIYLFLVAGIVSAGLFGMRWVQSTQSTLLFGEQARVAFGKMADEIRGSSGVYVGNVNTNGIFTGLTNGQPQIGTSLLIYPTTNTTNFVLYFLNATDESVRRTSLSSGLTTVIAQNVTNTTLFQAQDAFGNVQTNYLDSRVIHCTLQFYQTAPQTPMPTAYLLDTVITRRTL